MESFDAFFDLDDSQLADYLMDKADEPCGKTTPERFVSYVRLTCDKFGCDQIVSSFTTGLSAMLRRELSASNLRCVRKALQHFLVVVYAMELEVVEWRKPTKELFSVWILAVEIVKVYLAARGNDMEHLNWQAMRLTD